MKIVWIIGTALSEKDFEYVDAVNNSGGWNNTQLRLLSSSNRVSRLIVISVRPEYGVENKEEFQNICIYKLPYNPVTKRVDRSLINRIAAIVAMEEPDICDIQGTETTYSAVAYTKLIKCPIIVTLHGIAYQCDRFYTRGLPLSSLILDRSLVDTLTFKGILEKQRLMHSRSNIEKRIIKSVKYVRGRTNWDEACIKCINPSIDYYHEELILRDAFSKKCWDINQCQTYRIFTTQSNSPLKSLYTLLETVALLKRKYGEVLLVVPGHALRTGFIKSGYDKVISKRIKKLKIEKNVMFTGNLSANQVAEELMKAHVFVLQSEIENSPNSLSEAQMVGTPVVSTFTGGTPEYVTHGESGFLYNSFDPVMAAMYIERLFEDDELCMQMSRNERIVARQRHNQNSITDELLEIYQSIINKEYTK